MLGGLLSAYDLSREPVLLEQAKLLGDRLLAAFRKEHHYVPYSDVDLRSHLASNGMGKVSISEATTVQLEFKGVPSFAEPGYTPNPKGPRAKAHPRP